jgi:type III secretion protein T
MDSEIIANLSRALICLALAVPRVHLALMFVPMMALKETQGLIRSGIVLAVALPIAVSNFYSLEVTTIGTIGTMFMMLKEAAIGIVLGYLLSLPFNLFISVGAIIDNQRGATSGQAVDPTLGNTSLLGSFMQKAFVIVLIEAGSFGLIFGLVMDTYVLWPSWQFYPEPLLSGQALIIDYFSVMTQKIMLYVLPILVVMLLIDLAFAVLGLFSPQLQVYFLSMPAKSLVALLCLAMYATTLFYYGQLEIEKIVHLRKLLPTLFHVDHGYE